MSETTVEAPVKKKKRTPQEELKYLERKAIEYYGISDKEFYRIRAMGQCPNQIQDRAKMLRDFITAQQG